MTPPTDIKAALRARALEARKALGGETRRAASQAITERALARLAPMKGMIGAYAAFRDEFNPLTLLEALAERGHLIALPCTPRPGEPLTFRAWAPGDRLVAGRMNIPEPAPDAPEAFPEVLLLPPVAFDRRCYRIGYGAGFYDRTIPVLRNRHAVATLGVAFAAQEADTVPAEPHDVPLDAIATERELIVPGAP